MLVSKMGHVITQTELFERLERELAEAQQGRTPFTLILGSGFSFPIIPTTRDIVYKDLPWWIWCQNREPGGPSPDDFGRDDQHGKFTELALPRLFREPIAVVREQLAQCNFEGIKVPRYRGENGQDDTNRTVKIKDAGNNGPSSVGSINQSSAEDELDLGDQVTAMCKRLEGLEKIAGEGGVFDAKAMQLARIRERLNVATDLYFGSDPNAAIPQFNVVIESGVLDPDEHALALFRRGVALAQAGLPEKAIQDYTTAIELRGTPVELKARCLFNRALAHGTVGLTEKEIGDYTAATELVGCPPDQIGKALVNRGVVHARAGHLDEAIQDFTKAIKLGVPPPQMAKALFNRGLAHSKATRADEAIEDFTGVTKLIGTPVEELARALNSRGVEHAKMGRTTEAINDFSAVTKLDGLPTAQLAKALYNRGRAQNSIGQHAEAIEDYTAVIKLATPVVEVANALFNRGMTHKRIGQIKEAIDDLTAIIELPGASPDLVAEATSRRTELQDSN